VRWWQPGHDLGPLPASGSPSLIRRPRRPSLQGGVPAPAGRASSLAWMSAKPVVDDVQATVRMRPDSCSAFAPFASSSRRIVAGRSSGRVSAACSGREHLGHLGERVCVPRAVLPHHDVGPYRRPHRPEPVDHRGGNPDSLLSGPVAGDGRPASRSGADTGTISTSNPARLRCPRLMSRIRRHFRVEVGFSSVRRSVAGRCRVACRMKLHLGRRVLLRGRRRRRVPRAPATSPASPPPPAAAAKPPPRPGVSTTTSPACAATPRGNTTLDGLQPVAVCRQTPRQPIRRGGLYRNRAPPRLVSVENQLRSVRLAVPDDRRYRRERDPASAPHTGTPSSALDERASCPS